MDLFRRPKTPTPARPSLQSDTRPQPKRPKLSDRFSTFPACVPISDEDRLIDYDDLASTTRELEAVRPFDYLRVEDEHLYLGSRQPLRMAETIHSKVMFDMTDDLPAKYNGELCLIFESYRHLLKENTRLAAKEQDEATEIERLHKTHKHEEKQWRDDEADYRKEIKRLETIIAYSNHGIEGVIKARKNSVIRMKREACKNDFTEAICEESEPENPESLFEFLAGSRRKDLLPSELPLPQKKRNASDEGPTSRTEDALTTSSGFTSSPEAADSMPLPSLLLSVSTGRSSMVNVNDKDSLTRPAMDKTDGGPELRSKKLRKEREDASKSRAPSAMGLGNAWSNLMPWNARRIHRKQYHDASDPSTISNTATETSRPASPCASARPVFMSSERDLRRRPFSFYNGDELDFEQTLPPKHRQRSVSLSEVHSPEKLPHTALALNDDVDHYRPVSLDSMRPTLSNVTKQHLLNQIDGPARVSSKSSVLTTIHKPKPLARGTVKLIKKRQEVDAGSGVSVKDLASKALRVTPTSTSSIVKSTTMSSEVDREPSPVAAAAAKAAASASGRHTKENEKSTATAQQAVDQKEDRNGRRELDDKRK